MRKSFKLAPGVRLNVSKSGLGASFGTRGARYSVHSSGRRTTTVGMPGTGMGWSSTASSRSRPAGRSATRDHRSAAPPPVAPPPKPSVFAPRGEKALYKLINAGRCSAADLETIARDHPGQWLPAATLAGLRLLADGDSSDTTVGLLRSIFEGGRAPEEDPFITKYLAAASSATIGVAPGVTVQLPFSRDLIGLALAEVLQERGELDDAIDIVERVTPTTHAAVSLAELYSESGRHDDVIDLTNGVTNDNDSTALLLVYRGIAFTREGLFEAARESFKEALKSKKRANEVRHLALRQRAETYVAEGKNAQARRDLQRILADDATVDGVRQRLDELTVS